MALRIIFMGTPDFSVPTLHALHQAGHEIIACYSQPPRPAGKRGLKLVPSAVQQASEKLGIKVHTPLNFKSLEEQERFAAYQADVAVVVAYGLLLPLPILNTPQFGCYNGHASLLPRWRGAAPLQRALMHGDQKTGMMIMKMHEGLDTGPIAMHHTVPLTPRTTLGQLHDQLANEGAALMVKAMAALEQGNLSLTPQPEEGTLYAAKISKGETKIDWNRPAKEVQQHIMGLSPFPAAWFEFENKGKPCRVKVLDSQIVTLNEANTHQAGDVIDDQLTIACAEGAVQLLTLHKAGSKPMEAKVFLQGNELANGTDLRGTP